MEPTNTLILENSVRKAFDSGYAHAAASLSMMTQEKIQGNSFLSGTRDMDEAEFLSVRRNGPCVLLTTEIFGDITGKSYLFLSQADVAAFTAKIYGPSAMNDALREEYLKEVDNILSAAVITKLSNELGLKLFGDIPILAGNTGCNANEIIRDDFSEIAESIYINAATFAFEGHPNVTPCFIWVIDSSIVSSGKIKSSAA